MNRSRTIRSMQLANQRADTPRDVEVRRIRSKIGMQAYHETQERFPIITMGNAQAALDFQRARIRELEIDAGVLA